MRIKFPHTILAGAFSALLLATSSARAQTEPGFTSLFDGQTLNGWKFVGKGGFDVTNGIIVCPKTASGDLFTEKEFSDFVLRLDFKIEAGGNNGIGIRTPLGKPGEQMAFSAVEIQILDDKAPKHANIKPWQFNGSVYGLVPAKNGTAKIGEWNSYDITVQGRHYKIALNGRTIVNADLNDVTDPEMLKKHPGMFRERGRIGFLGHGDHVEFRNIRIKELPVEEKDNKAPKGFSALFNGKNLDGWKGLPKSPNDNPAKRATLPKEELAKLQAEADERMRQHWKVENGALAFDGKGDSLCTKKDYADFELLVDWKISPHGDSGIYLRGSPQVQIWDPHTKPTKNGSEVGSGGLYNNKQNPSKPLKVADLPIGEWNRFRIIMVGEKVHVFLNGELVVNETTLENYWDREKPIFPTGQIELQNHGDHLWFKNVYVRELRAK